MLSAGRGGGERRAPSLCCQRVGEEAREERPSLGCQRVGEEAREERPSLGCQRVGGGGRGRRETRAGTVLATRMDFFVNCPAEESYATPPRRVVLDS